MRRRAERIPVASVVIPVHDAADVVGDQMQALCAQTGVDHFEVIAVLNRCTDGSAAVIQSFADRLDVRIEIADRLASAAYARNTGASAARSDRVLFCDADDRVSPTWVRDLAGGLETADFVGGWIIVDRDGLAEWAYRYFYAHHADGMLVREGRIPHPISASMAIDKRALFAVDGFDETFTGASGEETDLSIRLVRAGFRVGFVDGAVLHYRPRTRFRELARQQRSRAFSNSRLSLREGADIPHPSARGRAYRTVRRLGRRVLRERILHPLALASDVLIVSAQHDAAVWAATATESRYDDDPEVLDFVVALGTPVVGGLAFRTQRSTVQSDARADDTLRALLDLLGRVLAPGDEVVDLGAWLGITTVAIAHLVGPTGAVTAVETDPNRRALLRSNLLRHGCDRVRVLGGAADVSSGGGAVVVERVGGSDVQRAHLHGWAAAQGDDIRTWLVAPPSSGADGRVDVSELADTRELQSGIPAGGGWVVAVPAARHPG